jgi:hypothetical protein
VTCTAAEAQDMLDYFGSTADVLTTLGDARAGACALAVGNRQREVIFLGYARSGSQDRARGTDLAEHHILTAFIISD